MLLCFDVNLVSEGLRTFFIYSGQFEFSGHVIVNSGRWMKFGLERIPFGTNWPPFLVNCDIRNAMHVRYSEHNGFLEIIDFRHMLAIVNISGKLTPLLSMLYDRTTTSDLKSNCIYNQSKFQALSRTFKVQKWTNSHRVMQHLRLHIYQWDRDHFPCSAGTLAFHFPPQQYDGAFSGRRQHARHPHDA